MNAIHDEAQIVHVIKPFRLIDEDSYERVYWRRDGQPLVNGYYVVSWPRRAKTRTFNEDAIFRGPFRNRPAAQPTLRRVKARRRGGEVRAMTPDRVRDGRVRTNS